MIIMNCRGCNKEGIKGPLMAVGDDVLEKTLPYVYKNDSGPHAILIGLGDEHFCYPCWCKVTLTCLNCTSVVNILVASQGCKTGTYVCMECDEKGVVHVWECYKNGCMTPSEVAQEEYEMLMAEEEEDFDE